MKKEKSIFIASIIFGFLTVISAVCFFAFGDYSGKLIYALIGMAISGAFSALFFWLSNTLFDYYLQLYYNYRKSIINNERKENDKIRFNEICRQIGIAPETKLEVLNGGKTEEVNGPIILTSTFIKEA